VAGTAHAPNVATFHTGRAGHYSPLPSSGVYSRTRRRRICGAWEYWCTRC
jgi:hypothetical protein